MEKLSVQQRRILNKLKHGEWRTADEIGIIFALRTLRSLAKIGLIEIDDTDFESAYHEHKSTIPNPTDYLKFRLKKQE